MWIMAEYNPVSDTVYNDTYQECPDYISALDKMMRTFKNNIAEVGKFEFEWDGNNQPKRVFIFDKEQEEGYIIFNRNLTLH
jgi:hypothetical protein